MILAIFRGILAAILATAGAFIIVLVGLSVCIVLDNWISKFATTPFQQTIFMVTALSAVIATPMCIYYSVRTQARRGKNARLHE